MLSLPLKTFIFQLSIVGISCTFVACATPTDDYESAGDPAPIRGNDCILQSSIRDYRILDDKNLIVSAGPGRKYHVELSRRAFGLRSNWSIGFVSPTGTVCRGSSEILVDDGFGRKETIMLSSVRRVSEDELDALLVQSGHKEPDIEQTVEPEEVEGAAVEELD